MQCGWIEYGYMLAGNLLLYLPDCILCKDGEGDGVGVGGRVWVAAGKQTVFPATIYQFLELDVHSLD
jgi:hypothetical protein